MNFIHFLTIGWLFICLLLLAGCSETTPHTGLVNGRLMQCPDSPNCVSSESDDNAHSIEPLIASGNLQESMQMIENLLKTEPQAIIAEKKEGYLRAEYHSAFFGFIDDVEFNFAQNTDQKEATTIHIRSASRTGYYDFGVNRKRIERLREKFIQQTH